MIHRTLLLLTLVLAAGCTSARETASRGTVPADERYRVVIMTDMTHDDGNSLIRYLYYAPYFDTEAIIVTPQLPDYNHDAAGPWEKAQAILAAYRQERDQLARHDPGFPTFEALSHVTRRGRGALPIIWLTEDRRFAGDIAGRYVESSWGPIRFDDWIGEGLTPNSEPKDSEGSAWLQEVFDRDDDRPIFVQLWGGPITLVQALYRYEQRRGPEKLQALLDKLHVYSIHLQDVTTDYFIDLDAYRGSACAHLGETRSTYDGPRAAPAKFVFDMGHFWKYLKVIPREQVNGHGPLSARYDGGGEGDTPAFLYLVSAALGLNDPLDPTQGGWGNMFHPMDAPFPAHAYHTCPGDRAELERWIPEATNSFMARLRWSMLDPDEANHPPKAVVNDDRSARVLRLSVDPGNEVVLDAAGSSDPDGDALRFRWFHYAEADGYDGTVDLPRPDAAKQSIRVPADLGARDLHLVVEVRDDGAPELVAYRRVILKGTPRP